MSYNPADPKQVKRARKKAKLEAMQADEELAALLELPHFRRFVSRMLTICHHRTVYTGFSANPGVMAAFLERENIGKVLLDWVLQVNPNAYTLLMIESGAKLEKPAQAEEPNEGEEDATEG